MNNTAAQSLPNKETTRLSILQASLDALDTAGIPWCILHNSAALREGITTDVDLLVIAHNFPDGVARALQRKGLHILQCRQHEATSYTFIVGTASNSMQATLQLDVSSDIRRDGLIVYSANEIIRCRRREGSYWKPSAEHEFTSYLIKRIGKESLTPNQAVHLTSLYHERPESCKDQLQSYFPLSVTDRIVAAAQSGDWHDICSNIHKYRQSMRRYLLIRRPLALATYYVRDTWRLLNKWLRPAGLMIAVLGPDGSGKSTAISAFSELSLEPFTAIHRFHLSPGLLTNTFRKQRHAKSQVTEPYAASPHSNLLSALKICFWAADYLLGYWIIIRPQLAKSSLVIFDRYAYDWVADPLRFRYSGPTKLTRLLARLVPQPSITFVLDAPPSVLQDRKSEVSSIESENQRLSYLRFADCLESGIVVEAAQPVNEILSELDSHVTQLMLRRTSQRLGLSNE